MAIIDQAMDSIVELEGGSKEIESDQVDFVQILHLESPVTNLDFDLVFFRALAIGRPQVEHFCFRIIEPFGGYIKRSQLT